MKGLLVLIIAIATCAAHAQQPAAPCLKLVKVKVEDRVLHQNGATSATLTLEGKHCYVLNEARNIGRQGPVFEITPQPGINVETVEVVHDPATMHLADFKAGEIAVKINLTATPDAPLGKHSLPMLVHYQVMDSLGNVSNESLTFNMPIKVAKAEQLRLPGPPFAQRHPVWAKVLLPFEIAAMIPLFILAGLMGWDGC